MKPVLQFAWTCITFMCRSLYALIIYLYESLERAIASRAPDKKGFDASFQSPSSILSSFNKGYCLNGTTFTSTHDAHLHSLILSPSGGGKSSVVIIPTIFNLGKHGHSICTHDPSGELYHATAGFLAREGYDIKILDFARPEVSDGFNPIPRASTSSEIQKLITTFVQNKMGKSSNDEFWNSQAISLIALMVAILKKHDVEYQNFTNVKHLIDSFQGNPEGLDQIVAEYTDEHILKEYKAFLRTDKKVMSNIVATCRSALSLFMDNSIQKVTSFDSIHFEAFRQRKTALFVTNKTSDMAYYSPLSSVFFLQFFNHIMSRPIPAKGTRSIFFVLDEASSLQLPNTLQIACANLRKYFSGIMLVCQDYHQLVNIYGKNEAEAIRSNCFAKVYFPGQSIDTAKELEAMLGKKQYTDDDGKTHTRSLLTADEIQTMPKGKALIFAGSNRGIYTSMKPYYERFAYKRLASIPPPERITQLSYENVPLLPIPNDHETDPE